MQNGQVRNTRQVEDALCFCEALKGVQGAGEHSNSLTKQEVGPGESSQPGEAKEEAPLCIFSLMP